MVPIVSCGHDVEDELARELDDNPGTAMGTKKFRFCKQIFSHFWSAAGFLTTGPLIRISVFFVEFAQRQDGKRVLKDLHRHEELKVVNVHCLLNPCDVVAQLVTSQPVQ